MRIYAIDDERFMLEALVEALEEGVPQADVVGFDSSLDLLARAKEVSCDVAFLDVQMPDMDGIKLAKQLIEIRPETNIVFVTAFEEYKADAMDLHASDYVTKPVTAEKLREAMRNLRHPVMREPERFCALTFGNFAFCVDGRPVDFHRRKSAELLAYLVHRRGTIISRQELTIALFGDERYSRKSQKLLYNALHTLSEDLAAVGASEVLVKTPVGFAVDWGCLTSDLADYLAGNTGLYCGEYMEQYSWGESFKAWVAHNPGPTATFSSEAKAAE